MQKKVLKILCPSLASLAVAARGYIVFDFGLQPFCRLRLFTAFTGLYPTEYIFVPDCARFVPFTFILKFLLCLLFYLCFNYYYDLYLY